MEISGISVLLGALGLTYFIISFFSVPVGLVIMVVSMLFSPEIPVGAIGTREIVIRIEDLLIPILIIAWLAHTTVYRQPQAFVKSPLNVPILSLLGLSVFSTVFGALMGGWLNPFQAVFYLGKTIEFFAVFFLVLNNVRTEREIKVYLFFTILTLTLLVIYTTWQVPGTQVFSAHRLTAPFEGDKPQPATVGGYIAFFLMIVLSLLIYERNLVRKWFFSVLSILIFISLLYTFNRTSYLAFLGGVFLLGRLARRRWLNYLLLGLLFLSPILLPQSVKERIAFTWEDAKNPSRFMGVDYSLQERIFSFQRAWYVMKVSPIYGMGVTYDTYTDNQYSRTLMEVGLAGLAFWLWIYFRLFKIGRWLHDSSEESVFKGLALGYSAGILCILLHAFGSVTFYTVRIMEPFWFVSGLVVSLYVIKTREYAHAESSAVA